MIHFLDVFYLRTYEIQSNNLLYKLLMAIRMFVWIILLIGITFHGFGQRIEKDTTFIFKDTVNGELQSIYIDYNPNNEYYKRLSDFKFFNFDEESYRNSLNYFIENNIKLPKKKPLIPYKNWVSLKQYREKFYVYYPCDFLFHFSQSINDSTFIDWTGEGPLANKIIDQKKIDRNTYLYELTSINGQLRTIIVHIIDTDKRIAVFEEFSTGCVVNYYLMIATDKITSVPIIINSCPSQKQRELVFDSIDVQTLLPSK